MIPCTSVSAMVRLTTLRIRLTVWQIVEDAIVSVIHVPEERDYYLMPSTCGPFSITALSCLVEAW